MPLNIEAGRFDKKPTGISAPVRCTRRQQYPRLVWIAKEIAGAINCTHSWDPFQRIIVTDLIITESNDDGRSIVVGRMDVKWWKRRGECCCVTSCEWMVSGHAIGKCEFSFTFLEDGMQQHISNDRSTMYCSWFSATFSCSFINFSNILFARSWTLITGFQLHLALGTFPSSCPICFYTYPLPYTRLIKTLNKKL